VDVFWIDPTLAITTRPRGGDWLADELSALKREGVSVVVSCLTDPEERELGLAHEAQIAGEQGLCFVRTPIEDRGTPANAHAFAVLVDGLLTDRAAGCRIAVHCRQGLGRAPLVAASILVSSGTPADDAWTLIAARREQPVPDTDEQREWVHQFARRRSRAGMAQGS
jgi:protein-tyrosine phosphatase